MYYLYLNFNNKALANTNIRKALSLAIDRKDLCNKVLKDGSREADGFVSADFTYGPDGKEYRSEGKDYLSFMPMDRDGVREVFVEAIEANADDPDVDFINIYFNELTTDYKNDLVETDYYLEQYEWLASLLDKVTAPEADSAKETFDTLFVSSDAAGCDNIEQIFKARS